MTAADKAPERIWAWDDKTPTERDKGWSACDAGAGSTVFVRADLYEAAQARIAELEAGEGGFGVCLGSCAVRHLREMYPAAYDALGPSGRRSLRNYINSRAALQRKEGDE